MNKWFLTAAVALLSMPHAHAQSLMEAGQVLEAHNALSTTGGASPLAGAGGSAATNGVPAAPATAAPAAAADKGRQSLFFSNNQIASIMRASQGYVAPKEAYAVENQTEKPADSGPRVLSLSGIVYHGAGDWTIWFNGQRLQPGKLPERMMNLAVHPGFITLKWMDLANQRIINLTLYPHQQYNIDTNTISPSS